LNLRRFYGAAAIGRLGAWLESVEESVEYDPQRSKAGSKSRTAAISCRALIWYHYLGPPARHVDGSPDAVILRAKQAELSEVLDALTERFGVHVRPPVSPGNPIDGTFAGPLNLVIGKLLSAYNYAIFPRRAAGRSGLEIILVGKKSVAGVPSSPPAPAIADTSGREQQNLPARHDR
jgi:hypothetical protein